MIFYKWIKCKMLCLADNSVFVVPKVQFHFDRCVFLSLLWCLNGVTDHCSSLVTWMSKLCFGFSYKCLNFCVYKGSPSNLSSALVYVPLRVLELKWRENVAKVQCSAAFLTESHSADARVMTKVTAQASIAIVQNTYTHYHLIRTTHIRTR